MPMVLKGELHQMCDYITNIINPYMWPMAWQLCHFLLAFNTDKCSHRMSTQMKPKIITYHLCQITLNQKLLHKFEKWCKFSSCIKGKLCKKKSRKMRPACNLSLDIVSHFLHPFHQYLCNMVYIYIYINK